MAPVEHAFVGIDVGSAHITITSWPGTQVVTLPCCLAQDSEETSLWPPFVMGEQAEQQAITNPVQTAWAWPRLLASAADGDLARFEQGRSATVFGANDRGDLRVQIRDQPLSPEEGLGHLLRQAAQSLRSPSMPEITEAVLTVPAQLPRAQRQALSHAARIAGLKVVQLVAAPVAAAMSMAPARPKIPQPEATMTEAAAAKGAEKPAADADEPTRAATSDAQMLEADAAVVPESEPETAARQHVLIVDFGAGSFDVAAVTLDSDDLTVHSLRSVSSCGGDAIDDILVQGLATAFFEHHGIDLRKQPMAHERLRQAVGRARQRLDQDASSQVELPYIAADQAGVKHLQAQLSRAQLRDAAAEHISAGVEACRALFTQAQNDGFGPSAIWVTGGLTQTPGLSEALAALGAPVTALPQHAAALGAARLAAVVAGNSQGPKMNLSDLAREQAAPQGAKRGLSTAELDAILQRQEALLAEQARLQAFGNLRGRAQTVLANLGASMQVLGQTEGAEEPDEAQQWLQQCMAAVETALADDDASARSHDHLTQQLQTLDVAAAQWQRRPAHA